MGKRKTNYDESLLGNTATYGQYLRVLSELAVSMFEWKQLFSFQYSFLPC